MRIGIDMLGLQSPHSRGRGIGRYAGSLVAAMIAGAPDEEFFFYAHDGLPVDGFPTGPNATIRPMPEGATREESVDRLARADPDGLDLLLLLSPFEVGLDYAPPARPLNRPAMAAVVYDLLPFVFQERHLTDPPWAAKFYRDFERLRRYDTLLAISEATRADLLRLLGIAGTRVVNIRGASDPEFFAPGREEPEALRSLGIDRPFVFCVASADPRKNLWGLLDAFRLLDESTRLTHQLVVTCHLSPDDARRVRDHAEKRGIVDSLVLTGAVPDETLRSLYRQCAAFAFPSLYEGLGLPLLEAMHCGAAVVAGNNTSQPEFVGDAGLLVNAHDAGDIAAKLSQVLTDRTLADGLRNRGPIQAGRFTWDSTAATAMEALRNAVRPTRRLRADPPRARKPRIAVFSPFPPKASGIADYSARLVRELRSRYAIDLYHDEGYEPDFGRDGRDFGMFDHRLFARNAAILDYHAVVYQMGNSLYHRFVYDALLRHPGLVTLHDFGLAGFHHGHAHQPGAVAGHFAAELRHSHPDRATFVLEHMDDWVWDEGTVQDAFAARDLPMNRRVFEAAAGVIVHSPLVRSQAEALHPDLTHKVRVVPMGSHPRAVGLGEKLRLRDRFGLDRRALIFASFGILHASKMNEETIDAFAPVARAFPEALLAFVGKDLDGGRALARAEALGLRDRVRFLGRREAAEFADLIAASDVGICLRRPPTNGETSAALLDLLRHGIPTIATDTGTFRDYPDHVLRRVSWEDGGIAGLTQAMLDLAGDREALGQAAARHVADHHAWSSCARGHADAIEALTSSRLRPTVRRPLAASR